MRVLLTVCFLLHPAVLLAQGLLQVPGVVHVHTAVSSGEYPLDELVRRAKGYGIEAIVLTDNHLLKFEYGLFPLRHLLRKSVEMPSVLTHGPDRYLSLIRQAREKYPEMVLIPGVEVIPHYYWTGSLYRRNLTMYNGQKNLLIVGFEQPEDYLKLPVIGNPGAGHRYGRQDIVHLLPGLLLIPGVYLLKIHRKRTVRLGGFFLTRNRYYRWEGSFLILLGLAFLINYYAYTQTPFTPYQTDLGLKPYQQLIEHVNRQGGLSFWSLPEARDDQVLDYGRLGALRVKTDPYPEDLVNTRDYTGFAAIYPDLIPFTDPGGRWDQILNEYLLGIRSSPPWGIGENAYHREGHAGKSLLDVETVFLVPEKTREAVLSAMRHGRMYALRRTEEYGLVLDDFSMTEEGSQKRAFSGDELTMEGKGLPEIRIAVSTTDGRSQSVQVRLVRSGKVMKVFEGVTPFTTSYRDDSLAERAYYRLDIGGGAHHILSNPIFVKVPPS